MARQNTDQVYRFCSKSFDERDKEEVVLYTPVAPTELNDQFEIYLSEPSDKAPQTLKSDEIPDDKFLLPLI